MVRQSDAKMASNTISFSAMGYPSGPFPMGVSRNLVPDTVFCQTFMMVSRAPLHTCGPWRRYVAGTAGPKKHLKAKAGSLKRSEVKVGLTPILAARASW